MGFLQRFRYRKVQGAELVVTGGITIFFSKIIGFLGPLALIGYGLYRWLFRKNYKQGITSIAAGIILLILLKGPLYFLTLLPYAAGAILVAYGAFLMIIPGTHQSLDMEESVKIGDKPDTNTP